MREAWTDDRLDVLNREVANGFAEVDKRFDRLEDRFSEVNRRLEKVEDGIVALDARLDGLQRTLLLASAGVIAALIGTQF